MADIEDRIREHAYKLWEQAGCPEGRSDEFWQRAKDVELGNSQPAEKSEEAVDDMVEDSFPASDPPGTGNFA